MPNNKKTSQNANFSAKLEKKGKFEEQDGVYLDGLNEPLGTKIGNDARLINNTITKQEIYFKMCGMNGIIDLSDVMPGSQLYNLPKVLQEKTIQTLTKDVYVIKNTMENVEFYNMLMKAAESGAELYEYIQELDGMKCSQEMY